MTPTMDGEKTPQYGQEVEQPRVSDGKRGSIYEVVPPNERRMSLHGRRISMVDDIFGEIKEGGPNYRNVSGQPPQTNADIQSRPGID